MTCVTNQERSSIYQKEDKKHIFSLSLMRWWDDALLGDSISAQYVRVCSSKRISLADAFINKIEKRKREREREYIYLPQWHLLAAYMVSLTGSACRLTFVSAWSVKDIAKRDGECKRAWSFNQSFLCLLHISRELIRHISTLLLILTTSYAAESKREREDYI